MVEFKHERIKNYKYIKELGTGGQGRVFKVSDQDQRHVFALKLFNYTASKHLIKREIETLEKLHHPNIIKLYDASLNEQEGEVFIRMQYMQHGNLENYLALNKSAVCLKTKLYLIRDAAEGVKFLHQHNIIHRDIEPLIQFDKTSTLLGNISTFNRSLEL